MPNNNETRLESSSVSDNISMSQERTRTWLAKGTFVFFAVLLIIVTLLSFILDKEYFLLFDSTISGLTGLMGIILGFYFGSKSK